MQSLLTPVCRNDIEVSDDEPEITTCYSGMKLAEKNKENAEVCNAIGAHHDEIE